MRTAALRFLVLGILMIFGMGTLPGVADAAKCPADFDQNGWVDAVDLAFVADAFGESACGPECLGDLDDDGDVDGADLVLFLASFGRTDCLGVTLSADPSALRFGESTTLTWTSRNAASRILAPEVGTVAASGSLTVAPPVGTTYTLTVVAGGDSVTVSVTVTVDTSTTALQGKIVDGATGLGLSGVTVTATDGQNSWTTTTGASGDYTLVGLNPGALTIAISKAGYQTQQYTADAFGGEMVLINTALDGSTGFATLFGTVSDQTTGLPLPGAVVSVTDAGGAHSAGTDADGVYLLAGILPGQVALSVTCTGYLPLSGQVNVPGTQAYTLNFALPASNAPATLTGTVTNSRTLLPEPDVSISVVNTGLAVVTGPDGTFSLPGVPMGHQQLSISKPGFVDTVQPVFIQTDPYAIELVFPFIMGVAYPNPVAAVLTGQVVDALSGRPVASAHVKILGTGRHAVTDAEGWYTFFGLPEQSFSMICMAQGHDAVLVNLTVQSAGAPLFNFSLTPRLRGTVTGTVTDESTGAPVRFAEVSIGEAGMAGASTEADGTFVLAGAPAGVYSLTVTHPEYLSRQSAAAEVLEAQTTVVNTSLARRPPHGDLEGIVSDRTTKAPIQGAVLSVDGVGASATTNAAGRYQLPNLPAGLVRVLITAVGYPATERTAAVVAREDALNPTKTSADFALDAADPSEPHTVSVTIAAAAGGSVESPDSRWTLIIPPGSLSGDAVLTLERLSGGTQVAAGDLLGVAAPLATAGIRAMGPSVRLSVKSSLGLGPAPILSGPVLLAGRYAQSQADASDVAEASVFPFYRNGGYWVPMPVSPFDTAVDEINNLPVAAVDFGSMPAYDGGPEGGNSYLMVLGGAAKRLVLPEANVKIFDKQQLAAVTQVQGSEKSPNPNALPILIVHGWDPLSIVMNMDHTDPNEGFDLSGNLDENLAGRYTLIVKDLIDATNGVYRPVFVSHNPRAGVMSIGQAMAGLVNPRNFFGIPSPGSPGSGNFPFLDAFGFSMGGLISRSYQAASGHVNNMVLAGTPNHGTFRFVDYLNLSVKFHLLRKAIELWSPGTKDLMHYDDRQPAASSSNPRLAQLNQNRASAPRGDLTLIAGADDSKIFGWLLPDPNDSVVPAESVFCRTSSPSDPPAASLLGAAAGAAKYEQLFEFNHFNFGDKEFRIKDVTGLKQAIAHGLSDWVVSKLESSTATTYPELDYIQYAAFEVAIEYNTFEPNAQDLAAGRDKRGIDRVAVLIYGKDEGMNWHVRGYALPDGTLTNFEPVSGNSAGRPETLRLSTSASFQLTDRITEVAVIVAGLKPGQTTVNLNPDAEFGLP